MKSRFQALLVVTFFAVLTAAPSAYARRSFDHSALDQFLKKYVTEEGQIDLEGIVKDPSLLDQYLESIALIDPSELNSHEWPREERLALWLNVYHAGLFNLLRRHYPVKNLQTLPGFWDEIAVSVAEDNFSLNNIRRGTLIDRFRDEKIHLVLACGAVGCPPMPREVYNGAQVEGQIFVAAKAYVNNPQYVRISPGDKKVILSRIFKWYAADFTLDFGHYQSESKFTPVEESVLSFIANYLDDPEQLDFLETRNFKIKYLPHDWTLNQVAAETPQ